MSEAALGFFLPTQPLRFCFWRMLSLIRAWRTDEKCLRYPSMCVERQRAQISKLSTLSSEFPFHFRACWGLKSSTTALLITSARHGNFVTQNRNALFWWDGDPWACPACHGHVLGQLFPIYARIYSVMHITFYACGGWHSKYTLK